MKKIRKLLRRKKEISPEKKKSRKRKKEVLLGYVNRTMTDHVGAYAAQAAYFIMLSFIPFILFITTLIRYTDMSYNMLSDLIRSIIPHSLQDYVMELVSEVYNRSSAVVPITALLALWSAGKAIQSLINGLNTIYHVKETRNWLINRVYAVFYTMLFGLAIVSSFLVLVVGDTLVDMLLPHIPHLMLTAIGVFGARTMLVCIIVFVIFMFLYKVLPNRPATLKSQAPGAAIIAVAWTIFSNLFSLYFELFPSFSRMYGSLTALIIMMFWLYWCMLFVLFGAEINAYFENQFRIAQQSMRELINESRRDEFGLEDIVLLRSVEDIPAPEEAVPDLEELIREEEYHDEAG